MLGKVLLLNVVMYSVGIAALFTGTDVPDPERDYWKNRLARERQERIEKLNTYWISGEFPINSDSPESEMSYFIGANGALCAVANLISQSGYHNLVEAVARENNHLKVADIRDGGILIWVDYSGLTRGECILVQRPVRFTNVGNLAAIVKERERIRKILAGIEEKLRDQTDESLELAVDRLLKKLHAAQ